MENSMREILSNTPRFSSRASYFSGRGATISDLDDEILQHIYKKIKECQGEEAAKQYVDMVASMPNMNATDFINNCYALESNGFKWHDKKPRKNGIDIAKNEDGEYNLASGFFSIFSAMGNDRDDTAMIRNSFLLRHGIRVEMSHTDIYGKHYRY